MRIKSLFFMSVAFALCMFAAQPALLAQQKGPKVTVNMQNARIRDVLKAIETSTDMAFFYNNADFDAKKIVSVDAYNQPVEEVIAEILPGFTCVFENKKIILVRPEKPATESGAATRTSETGVELSGVIRDSKGEPLVGASAIVKMNGKVYGGTADLDGKFSIVLPSAPTNENVTFSFLGFVDEIVRIGTRSYFEVVLKDNTEILDESIVVGYGTQKKVNLTGAVAAVSEDALKDRHVSNVGAALEGLIPNLNITQASGRPDASSTYNIRGNTSPNGGSPLILVDNVEQSLHYINVNDIESISVLKDASAAAIYGARGAFGVILVTTKGNGKFNQAPKVSLDARFSFSSNTASTDFETRGYYSAYIADMFMTTLGGTPYTSYTDYDYQRLWERRNDKKENPERPWVVTEMRNGRLSYVYLANFDWYNYMFDESRPTQEYNINVSGGTKDVSYFVSGRYYHQDGIFRQGPDDFDSFDVRAKLEIRIKPWLKLTSNTSFHNQDYYYHGNNYRRATLHALASFVPVNPDGTAVSHTSLTQSSSHYIMDGYSAMLQKGTQWGDQLNRELRTIWGLEANITKHFKFDADFAYRFRFGRSRYRDTTVEYSMYPGEIMSESTSDYPDRYSDTIGETNVYTANGYFTYENTWKGIHEFSGIIGFNYQSRFYTETQGRRNDLLSEELSDFNLATGNIDRLTGGVEEYALAGVFFRFTYGLKSRYLFEVDGRYDGSSRFLKGQRWGFFPSGSFAYRISEEPWMAPAKNVMNNMKIRLSYGSLGNQDIGYYDYYQTVSTGGNMSYTFNGTSLAGHATVGDPTSSGTWETVTTENVGLDLGFFRDKLTFSGDFYIRRTKGILTTGTQLPSIYGATEPLVNANDLRTTGYELQLEWKDSFMIGSNRFDYSVGATFADYTAVYTKADNPSGLLSEPYKGMKLGEIWGYRIGGLFANDAEAAAYSAQVDMSQVCQDYFNSVGEGSNGVRGGDMKYLDLNGDGVISAGTSTLDNPGDREVIGNSQPRYSYGFNVGFNFYGFDFYIFFQGIGHMDWYPGNDNNRFWGPYARPYESFVGRDFMSNVWSETNTGAYFPRARGYSALNSGSSLYNTNDRYLQNIGYLRLKNLTVGYTIPQKALAKAGISKIRVYFSGENLWYTSPIHSKYVDPEVMAIAASGDTYTFYKTFSFGVSLDF